jgi:hypothetical protein
MRPDMITFAPKHYLTTLVIEFSLSFGCTGPGYSMPSSATSAKHIGIKKPQPRFCSHAPPIDFFIDEVKVVAIFSSGGAGVCID